MIALVVSETTELFGYGEKLLSDSTGDLNQVSVVKLSDCVVLVEVLNEIE